MAKAAASASQRYCEQGSAVLLLRFIGLVIVDVSLFRMAFLVSCPDAIVMINVSAATFVI